MIWHKMNIERTVKETPDSISIHFHKPQGFTYKAGQYITIKVKVNEQVHKRAYSLSSAPKEEVLSITVKAIEGGVVSNYLNTVDVLAEEISFSDALGTFVTSEAAQHYFFAAGSGISPIFSMIKHLEANHGVKASLFYGNKYLKSSIFYNELDQLSKTKSDVFSLHSCFSCEHVAGYHKGRVTDFIDKGFRFEKDSSIYICGPSRMIDDTIKLVKDLGVPDDNIYIEHFIDVNSNDDISISSLNEVLLDGDTIVFEKISGNYIDTLIDAGYDPPYSCKIGNCRACTAKVMEGSVNMYKCESLDEDDIDDGYILACQAYPNSNKVILSFDD